MSTLAEPGTERLSLRTLARVREADRPVLEPASLSVGVVHLGLGAFSRAHQFAFIERAAAHRGEVCWAISAFSERSPAAAELLAAQDGLYSLRAVSNASDQLRVVASLRETHFALDEPDTLLTQLASPSVQLVTITVTEKGYRRAASGRGLQRDDPEILADARRDDPQTVIGQVVRGIEARLRSTGAPLTVLSCDNLPGNGELLAGLVQDFVALPGRFDRRLSRFIAESVTFPSSMVDRIVPAPGAADRAEASRRLGLADEAALVTEPFMQWVVEDRFAGSRPDLAVAGVEIVDDVTPYEELKLRTLNGIHSALAYLGALAGYTFVSEGLADDGLVAFVTALADDEVRASLSLPSGVDFVDYRTTVLERLANPYLPYRNLQVASDGSQKLPQRILATVRSRLRAGAVPRRGTLVVAAYLRCVCVGRDDDGHPIEVSDPLAEGLRRRVGASEDAATVVRRALEEGAIFGDLGEDEVFRDLLTAALADLGAGRARDVTARYASS